MKEFITDKDKLKLFFSLMYERQQIWYKRFILKLPQENWTDNKIFKEFKFTNVYRELDRTTQYLLHNIILNKSTWCKYQSDYDNHINLIWKILFFRIINNQKIFTDVNIIDDYKTYDADKFYNYLKAEVIDKNISFMHSAYQQAFFHHLKYNGVDYNFNNRCEYFAKFVLTMLHNNIVNIFKIMSDSLLSNISADKLLTYINNNIYNCSSFIAHELFQDLCYIEKYIGLKLMSWTSMSITNAGNGSTTGSKYIFKNVASKQDVIDAIKYLHSISKEMLDEIYREQYSDTNGFYYIEWNLEKMEYEHTDFNLTLSNVEHWLCEFSKYLHKLENGSKSRMRLYKNVNSNNELLY